MGYKPYDELERMGVYCGRCDKKWDDCKCIPEDIKW